MKQIDLSWADCLNLIEKIKSKINTSEVDKILAISRGGLIPSTILSHKLNYRHVYTFGVEFYKNKKLQEKPKIYQSLKGCSISDKDRILIIDDIADTGKSIQLVIKELEKINISKYLVATIFYKPRSIVVPNIYGKKIDNETWIHFPWEGKVQHG